MRIICKCLLIDATILNHCIIDVVAVQHDRQHRLKQLRSDFNWHITDYQRLSPTFFLCLHSFWYNYLPWLLLLYGTIWPTISLHLIHSIPLNVVDNILMHRLIDILFNLCIFTILCIKDILHIRTCIQRLYTLCRCVVVSILYFTIL